VNIDECHPGDRDDNLWVTINDYKPPKSQTEWEETCFLDKSYHGYYKWPKIIKYPMNKRERYTKENMPERVAILYEKFIDKSFISKSIQFMVLDEEEEAINFDIHRFRMFKGLFRNFGWTFVDNFMDELYPLIHEKTKKQEGSHRVAAEIVAGMIRGSKYWTVEMVCY
jgi:proteasome activator subunit 4